MRNEGTNKSKMVEQIIRDELAVMTNQLFDVSGAEKANDSIKFEDIVIDYEPKNPRNEFLGFKIEPNPKLKNGAIMVVNRFGTDPMQEGVILT